MANFCLDKTTVTHQLNHLEKDGYIRREISKEDGRCRVLYLTDKAEAIYPVVHSAWCEFTDHLLEGLSDEEKKQLDILTAKLAENARNFVYKEKQS